MMFCIEEGLYVIVVEAPLVGLVSDQAETYEFAPSNSLLFEICGVLSILLGPVSIQSFWCDFN